MAKIRYGVAMSLDGYIAGPNGEADWIVIEPEFDFVELWAQFDTLLMGRLTYQAATARLGGASLGGKKVVVVSRTMPPANHPGIIVVSELTQDFLQKLRTLSRKDIWLFGGGQLFRTLLEMKQVDTVEVSLIPVLLGQGIRLLPAPAQQTTLKLSQHKVYPSGRVSLTYEVRK